MIRAVGRSLATALLGGMAGVVWLALFYAWNPDVGMEFNVDPPRLATGVYPAERDPTSGLTFAWTAGQFALRLPGLDRDVEWVVDLRVRGGRPVPGDNPTITVAEDDIVLKSMPSSAVFEDVRVTIPARPERRGVTVSIASSSTFVPGPADPRPLGVMLDHIRLHAGGVVLPPRGAFGGMAAATAIFGAAFALLGITAGSSIGSAITVAAAAAFIVSLGFGPYTSFPQIAARLASVIGVALVALTAAVELVTRQKLRNTARFAAAFSASALLLKLLVLLHPDMPVGDALFHAHRFQTVLAGNLYFTSIAPGNYLFPYAPGLYVFAGLFSGLVKRGPADMILLRIVVAAVDACVGLLLYRAVIRARGDRLAGAIAVALYQLVPLGFGVMTVGNLTNAFAQSVSVAALAMMCAPSLRAERPLLVAVFTAVVTCAFLSHTSTFAILSAAVFFTALLFWIRGGPALRSPALAIGVALAAAVILSVALYYAHFIDTYRTELARVSAETAAAAPDAGGRSIGGRLSAIPRYLAIYYGASVLALAVWGAIMLWRRGADRLSLSIGGWSAACVAFLVLGVVTPIDMRYYLASIPAVAIAASLGAAGGWAQGGSFRALSGALLAWALWTGVRGWWGPLG